MTTTVPSQPFTIALLPLDIAWADPSENFQRIRSAVDSLSQSVDLIVLPELFSTGYITDMSTIDNLARNYSTATLSMLHDIARRSNAAISGSFLTCSAAGYVNRGFFIEPSGEETFYDKAHLFCLSKESDIFQAGQSHYPVVRFRGWNIALIVCYDLRFPAWCRSQNSSYDMMIVPANWPKSRAYAWEHLLIARAIENQAVYVGINRSGIDDFGHYDNMTIVVDAMGQPVKGVELSSGIRDSSIAMQIVTVDKVQLIDCRHRLPFQCDADTFRFHD